MLIGRVTEIATGRQQRRADVRHRGRYGGPGPRAWRGSTAAPPARCGGSHLLRHGLLRRRHRLSGLASNLDAPSGLAVTEVGPNQVTLTWADNSANEGGFRVERSADGVTFTRVAATGPDTTRFVATGLSSRTTYYFRVRAYNAGGDSAPTDAAEATTPAHPLRGGLQRRLRGQRRQRGQLDLRQRHLVRGGRRARGRPARPAPTRRRRWSGPATGPRWSPPRSGSTPWVDGEYARAGVTLFGGYNLVFTGRSPARSASSSSTTGSPGAAGRRQAGAAGYATFAWQLGRWYLFEMRIEEGTLIRQGDGGRPPAGESPS